MDRDDAKAKTDSLSWTEEDGVAVATLSTEQLSNIVAEWIAQQAGMAAPVQRHMQWAWSPGSGPVLLRGAVRPVPNVKSFEAFSRKKER